MIIIQKETRTAICSEHGICKMHERCRGGLGFYANKYDWETKGRQNNTNGEAESKAAQQNNSSSSLY